MVNYFESMKIFSWEDQDFIINNQSSFTHNTSEFLSPENSSSPVSDFVDDFTEPCVFIKTNTWEKNILKDFQFSDLSTQVLNVGLNKLVDIKEIKEYEIKFSEKLIKLINEETFEYGTENAADIFVQKSLEKSSIFTKDWLNSIFLTYFANIHITTGLLRIISHLKYSDIFPTGPTMALAALKHENAEVRECGIRAFENWDDTSQLGYLKHIKCNEKWLQDYLDRVIEYLEECYASFG